MLSLLISNAIAKHTALHAGVKVCYAPVKICKCRKESRSAVLAAFWTAAGFVVPGVAVVAERTAALLLVRPSQRTAGWTNAAQGMLATAFSAHRTLAVLAMATTVLIGRVGHIPGLGVHPDFLSQNIGGRCIGN